MNYGVNDSGFHGYSMRDVYPNFQGGETQSEAANPEPEEVSKLVSAPTAIVDNTANVDSKTHIGTLAMVLALVVIVVLLGFVNG